MNPTKTNILSLAESCGFEIGDASGTVYCTPDELLAFSQLITKEALNDAGKLRAEIAAGWKDANERALYTMQRAESAEQRIREVRRQVAVLCKFVVHEPTCRFNSSRGCTCGLDDALTNTSATDEAYDREHATKVRSERTEKGR